MGPEDFDYILPKELIAQYPLDERDASRLLVLSRVQGTVTHTLFTALKDYLLPGDLLVLNDTKVMPVRLLGTKESGAKVEIFLVRRLEAANEEADEAIDLDGLETSLWLAMGKSSKGLKVGADLIFDMGLRAKVLGTDDEGYFKIVLGHRSTTTIEEILERVAFTPLPPYIKREAEDIDRLRYQTVYARHKGAVAAPTAGLHFTPALLDEFLDFGVELAYVTLHTGPGTFMPVRAKLLSEHKMHSEFYSIAPEVFDSVVRAKREGRRVVAVGSTSVRALEAAVAGQGGFESPKLSGETGIFIYPGFEFKVVDAMLTNFHLPRSTLIMLVSALATREAVLGAYDEAVKERYRFFSYGDAMLII
ncbi:MAG: tRNA preQ1(34) S-adenosylmethionine ribosyltransferase-isomerase QueA [Thermodesulfobacteriota bacterium]